LFDHISKPGKKVENAMCNEVFLMNVKVKMLSSVLGMTLHLEKFELLVETYMYLNCSNISMYYSNSRSLTATKKTIPICLTSQRL